MSYEIATACDVRLAETFKSNPHLSEVVIDADAIQQTLQAIGQSDLAVKQDDQAHQILVIASHGDTLAQGRNKDQEEDTLTSGKFLPGEVSPYGVDTVSVAIAGVSFALGRMTKDDAAKTFQTKMQKDYGMSYASLRATKTTEELNEIINELILDKTIVEPADIIQETTVHELSHAVDASHADHTQLDKRYLRKEVNKAILFNITSLLGCIGILEYAKSVADYDSSLTMNVLSISALAVLANRLTDRRFFSTERNYKRYLNSPPELRARYNEVTAHQHPTIITVQ